MDSTLPSYRAHTTVLLWSPWAGFCSTGSSPTAGKADCSDPQLRQSEPPCGKPHRILTASPEPFFYTDLLTLERVARRQARVQRHTCTAAAAHTTHVCVQYTCTAAAAHTTQVFAKCLYTVTHVKHTHPHIPTL